MNKEINSIKVIEQVDMKEAVKRYNNRNPLKESFANTVKMGAKEIGACTCKCTCKASELPSNQNKEPPEKTSENAASTTVQSEISNLATNTVLPNSIPSTPSPKPEIKSFQDVQSMLKNKVIGKNKIILSKSLTKRQKYKINQFENQTNANKKVKTGSNSNQSSDEPMNISSENEYLTDEESQIVNND
jgi:hypothetical protein